MSFAEIEILEEKSDEIARKINRLAGCECFPVCDEANGIGLEPTKEPMPKETIEELKAQSKEIRNRIYKIQDEIAVAQAFYAGLNEYDT